MDHAYRVQMAVLPHHHHLPFLLLASPFCSFQHLLLLSKSSFVSPAHLRCAVQFLLVDSENSSPTLVAFRAIHSQIDDVAHAFGFRYFLALVRTQILD
jgi:hypothetical protein